MVHVNNIKLYEEQVRVQRIVVVAEESSECVREKIKLAGRDLVRVSWRQSFPSIRTCSQIVLATPRS